MCGIAGFTGKGKLKDLKQMSEFIAHRGPDGHGFWHDEKNQIYLAHRRLSIIDIEGGYQPMWTLDQRLCIIFNGEIYNHLELRKKLEIKGHCFQTDHSDTEVLLLAYREWGKDMVSRLNGMWAFALYDKQAGEVFLSRDRFGKKPLFYSLQNNTFAFSSELKSLIKHSNINANTSKTSLKKYFAYGFIPSPNSLFENIYKLPGGYNLILNIKTMNLRVWKYWDFILEPFNNIPKNPEDQWGEQIRELLSKAVQRRLMSDVPLGLFLSGGIDSSSIAAFASKLAGRDKIKTFCIGFSESSFDESEYSKKAASLFGTKHYSEILSIEKTRSILPEILEKLDEPMGDSSLIPTYLLCRETRKYVTVALGGDGADELFAGYDPFHALKLADIYQTMIPKPVHRAIRMLMARLPVSMHNMSLDFKIKRTLRGLSYPQKIQNPIWLGPLEPKELENLFNEPVNIEDIYSEAIESWESCPQTNLIDKTLQFYTKLYLQDNILTKIDRAGMYHGLEVRAPYLDIELVDFVRRIPARYKYRNNRTKYILKKALEPVLPDYILYRPKKGFGVPVAKWFRQGSLKQNNKLSLPFLSASFLKERQKEHIQAKHDHRLFLWNYWVLANYPFTR
ncbi:asparagine synthase (glutamine-hydrolysing) [Candidatus Magnetomoraceae bacterium gMMP-15]